MVTSISIDGPAAALDDTARERALSEFAEKLETNDYSLDQLDMLAEKSGVE